MRNLVQQRLKVRILVVDDDPQAREFVRAILAQAGLEVVEAASGREATERLAEQPFDLVCLDLSLPETSGFDLLAQLSPSTPALVLSARRLPMDRAQAEELGAAGYLTKPIEPERLVRQIRALLAARRRVAMQG